MFLFALSATALPSSISLSARDEGDAPKVDFSCNENPKGRCLFIDWGKNTVDIGSSVPSRDIGGALWALCPTADNCAFNEPYNVDYDYSVDNEGGECWGYKGNYHVVIPDAKRGSSRLNYDMQYGLQLALEAIDNQESELCICGRVEKYSKDYTCQSGFSKEKRVRNFVPSEIKLVMREDGKMIASLDVEIQPVSKANSGSFCDFMSGAGSLLMGIIPGLSAVSSELGAVVAIGCSSKGTLTG